jgi:long-subunit fatty acid transport protein
MIKKIILSACLLISFVSLAQQGTASPYSFYGIGDVRFKGTLENRSMAGVSVEQDSIHLNVENPASYASLIQTTFTVGGTYGTSKIKTDTEKANATRSTFDYLLLGIPMGKFGAGFGLIPVSSVGYKIREDNSDTQGEVSKQYEGEGGLNKVFLALAYKIKPNWNVGVDMQYNFGKIETTSIEAVTGVTSATREVNTSMLSGVNFNIGTMYQTKIYKKIELFTSLAYTFGSNLKSDSERTIQVDGDPDPIVSDPNTMTLNLPNKLTIGAGVGQARKWLIGTTLAFQGNGKFENYYNTDEDVHYEKYAKYAIGGYYLPNYTSFSSYFSRITYRAGLKYEKIGLVVNNESIKDVGLSLGAGFPITGSFSNVNFGIEYGKKGTVSSNLIQENYINFSLSFSFNDKWFVKSKFN